MKQTSCAITGHRPRRFPWGYDETDANCIVLKEAMRIQITALTRRGVRHWFSGMAQGADTWAAEIILNLRRKNPALFLHCVLPCMNQADKWPDHARTRYREILRRSDSIEYVSETYHKHCMTDRSRRMVEHAGMLLAVWDGTPQSGTGTAVRYARRLERPVLILDPFSTTQNGKNT